MPKKQLLPTPTPWQKDAPDSRDVLDRDGVWIATAHKGAADATRIVDRVNIHDELIQALEGMQAVLNPLSGFLKKPKDIKTERYLELKREMVRAVLKKAGAR